MTQRPDANAGGGILEAISARFPRRGNIYARIASAMTLYAACVVVTIGAVSYLFIDLQIRKTQRASMEASARERAAKLTATLDSVQESVSNISRNNLLVNALIDTSGNLPYIDTFIKDYRPAGHESVRLTLCDFQGNPVASNLAAPVAYGMPELLRRTVEQGLPFATVLPREGAGHGALFVVAYPIVWKMTNRPEGVLVAEIPAAELIVARSTAADDDVGLQVRSGDRVLFSRNYAGSARYPRFDIPLATAAPIGGLGLLLQVENHRVISLWWLIPIYAVSGGILLAFSMILARRLSLSVTSHLSALETAARRVAEGGPLESHAEVAGPDDVQALATSFNAMIDRVRSATEDLERRVRERTAELSAANAELVRLNRDKEVAIAGLKEALDKISTLRGLLPICAACKKIRDDKGYWQQIDVYISEHTEADFSHGICPECARRLYGKQPK